MNVLHALRGRFQSGGTEDRPAAKEVFIRTAPRPQHPAEHIVYPSDATPIQLSIATLRMRGMFDSSFFDICSVRDVMEILGVNVTYITAGTFALLKGLHCVSWKDMPVELAKSIPAMLSEVYTEGGSIMEAEVIDG